MELDGKRIIVTGAATGIGRATALTVAARGARVAAFDVNDGDGAAVVDEIIGAGGAARYWHVDVAVEDEVEATVAAATEWLGGGPDVLLHLAGILHGAWVDIAEFPEVTWDRVLDINLKGSFLVSKHVAPRMRQNGAGVIVLTSSGAGVTGGSSSYAYGSSKGGVHGLAMVLRGHLAEKGIRVNDVCPGNVVSPLKLEVIEEMYRRTGDRAAYDAEIAGLVAPEGIASDHGLAGVGRGRLRDRDDLHPLRSMSSTRMLRRSAADRYAPNTRASVPRLSRPDVTGDRPVADRIHEVGHGPQERVRDPARVEVERPRALVGAIQGQRIGPSVGVVVHQAERAFQGATRCPGTGTRRTAARAGCSGSRPPAPGAHPRSPAP